MMMMMMMMMMMLYLAAAAVSNAELPRQALDTPVRKNLRTKGVLVRRLPRWFGLLEPAWRDQIALQLGGPGGEKRREEKNQLVCPEPVLAKQHCFSDEPHSTMQTNSLNANVFVAVLALWRDDMRAR
jgi:hypothetical protein